MLCACCGCNKDPRAFSGTQKKKPAAKRKCASCTADTGSDAHVQLQAGASSPPLASCGTCTDHSHLDAAPTTANTPNPSTVAAVDIPAASDDGEADTTGCSACGKQLAGTTAWHQNWQKCSRCKQAFYCDLGCQREHWKRGGHKQACKEPMTCSICLDNDGPPLPIQGGCGCRGEAGCAHVACRIKAAEHQGLEFHPGWHTCATCKQAYTGVTQLGLAEALWERQRRKPARDHDRLAAQSNLASAYMSLGRAIKAEEIYRDLLATQQRLYGADDVNALVDALNLSMALRDQGKCREAEAVLRDTLERMKRVLGPEHKLALITAKGLAAAVGSQGKYAEAEPLLRDTLATQHRVHGYGHYNTLQTCRDLVTLLSSTRRYSEAEELSRGALAQARRTLGPEHPVTLDIAYVLGDALAGQQGKAVEAEALLTDTLAMQQRVRGPDHPHPLRTAQCLQELRCGGAWRNGA